MTKTIKVLLGSPIRQKTEIWQHFLQSIRQLNSGDLLEVDYFFVDDNIGENSGQYNLYEGAAEENLNICRLADLNRLEEYLAGHKQ